MRCPANQFFSLKYSAREIFGALGLLDHGRWSDMAQVADEGGRILATEKPSGYFNRFRQISDPVSPKSYLACITCLQAFSTPRFDGHRGTASMIRMRH